MRTRLIVAVVAAAGLLAACVPGVAGAAPAKPKPQPKPQPKIKVLVLGDSVGQGLALKGLQNDKRIETVVSIFGTSGIGVG